MYRVLEQNWKEHFSYIKACYIFTVSSKCSSHPSPVRAQQAWMCHWWSLTEVSWRLWEISATDMQPFTSCLLAKINSPAFLKSWSADKKEERVKKCRFFPGHTLCIRVHRITLHTSHFMEKGFDCFDSKIHNTSLNSR